MFLEFYKNIDEIKFIFIVSVFQNANEVFLGERGEIYNIYSVQFKPEFYSQGHLLRCQADNLRQNLITTPRMLKTVISHTAATATAAALLSTPSLENQDRSV